MGKQHACIYELCLFQVLAPPKQKGVYPFFTFADVSLGDVIDNTALGQVDISTVASGSHSSKETITVNSHSYDIEYTDEDFLVVDCRTNSLDATSNSLPPGLQLGSRQLASRAVKTEIAEPNGSSATCSGTGGASGT